MCYEDDFVTFEDDEGNEIVLHIVDYFLFDGQEYVILADEGEDEETETVDVFILKVDVIDEDTEEFVPLDEDKEEEVYAFAEKLLNGDLPNEDEIF